VRHVVFLKDWIRSYLHGLCNYWVVKTIMISLGAHDYPEFGARRFRLLNRNDRSLERQTLGTRRDHNCFHRPIITQTMQITPNSVFVEPTSQQTKITDLYMSHNIHLQPFNQYVWELTSIHNVIHHAFRPYNIQLVTLGTRATIIPSDPMRWLPLKIRSDLFLWLIIWLVRSLVERWG
jgi:hypothetical protein